MTTSVGKGGAERRHPDPDDEQSPTAAAACDDETEIVPPPPTEAARELAWSRDDGEVWDYPTTAWWAKTRQRVTEFFHPFADEARVAAMDDYDDTMGDDADDDDAEPIEIPDASWRAAFAAASPIVFAAAAVAFLIAAGAAWAYLKRESQATTPAVPDNATPTIQSSPAAASPAPLCAAGHNGDPGCLPIVHTETPVAAPPTTVTVTASPQAAPPQAPAAEPPAAAPGPDTVFRKLVRSIPGVNVISWDVTEAGAHRVCGYLRAGHSHDDAVQQVLANDPTFTAWQASAMVNASTTAYCPQYGFA